MTFRSEHNKGSTPLTSPFEIKNNMPVFFTTISEGDKVKLKACLHRPMSRSSELKQGLNQDMNLIDMFGQMN